MSLATIRVQSVSDLTLSDTITTVAPFAPGYFGGPLVADVGPTAMVDPIQFGARWPDGSWRHALVKFPVVVGPGEVIDVPLIECDPLRRNKFVWDSAAAELVAKNLGLGFELGSATVAFRHWINWGRPTRHTWVTSSRVRHGAFWADILLEFHEASACPAFWLSFGFSDQGPLLTHSGPEIRLVSAASVVSIRNYPEHVRAESSTGGVHRLVLESAHTWGDGQSRAMRGRLYAPQGARSELATAERAGAPLIACATTWRESGAFGPFGVVPEMPAGETEQETVNRAVRDYRAHRHEDFQSWPAPHLGLKEYPGQTGDQLDFAAAVCTAEAQGLAISRLLAVERSCYRESARPTHLRESDGSPLKFSERPEVRLWDSRPSRPHGSDLLGKPRQIEVGDTFAGYWGRDRQHWTCNYLATYALLTGDPWAVSECEHLAELWMGQMRVRTGTDLDNMGAARATGRTLHSACQLYLITDRDDLAHRIEERVDVVWQQWAGASGGMSALAVEPPADWMLGPDTPYTVPWQDCFGVMGLAAVDKVFGNYAAGDLAYRIASNAFEHGVWKPDDYGEHVVGKAVAWNDGVYNGDRAHDTNWYTQWAVPAARLYQAERVRRGLEPDPNAAAVMALQATDWRGAEWGAV